MKISIFGMGYVGAVSGACLADLGHEVIGVDKSETKVELINAGLSPIIEEGISDMIATAVAQGRLRGTADAAQAVAETDLSIISVGTPSAANGAPTLAIVEAVVCDIGLAIKAKQTEHAVVLRSTVSPGTTEKIALKGLMEHSGRSAGDGLEVCYNPEFLREGSAVKDFYNPPFTLAGAMGERGYRCLEEVYAGVEAPFIRTSCEIAESLKYISNSFHALKITFANEIGSLLKQMGMDSREAMAIFCQDRELNISPAYLRPGFAFGGSCLPKELRALQSLGREQNVAMPMLAQLLNSNQEHIERAFQMITAHGRHKIALFGLAFKPGTDDLRESPLVTLAERLIGRGYELAIFDRNVDLARLVGANREFIDREIPHLEGLLAGEPAEALSDARTVVIGHAGPEEKAAIAAAHQGRNIVDLQGVKEIQQLDGVRYEGICW